MSDLLALVLAESQGREIDLPAILAGIRRYQEAPRLPPPPPPPVVRRIGATILRDYGGAGPPVLVTPSVINSPRVLDLQEDCSLLRWLAQSGVGRVFLIDWGQGERDLDIDGHVTARILPLIDDLGESVRLLGYCLGGTMALKAASLCDKVEKVALLAAPWRFSAYGESARVAMARWWQMAEPLARLLGAVPMESLQPLFWRLDRAATVAKFAHLGNYTADDPAIARFVALEDWANDGAPIGMSAMRQICEDFFRRDLPGRGLWCAPPVHAHICNFSASRDSLVPADALYAPAERHAVDSGHVGMIVGARAPVQSWVPVRDFLRTELESQAGG